MSEYRGYFVSRSRPPRNVSSMMKFTPTTSPPSCSTRPPIASTVPPAGDLLRDRRAQDETPSLGAEDEIRLLVPRPRRKFADRLPQGLRVAKERTDVLEPDAGLRPVGNLANVRLEIDRHQEETTRPSPRQKSS